MSGLILAAFLALHAFAEEPVEPSPAPAAADPAEAFRLELEDAKALWFRGEADLARDKLRRLYFRAVSGEPIPLELSGECVIYLGEIEIERSNAEGAEQVWRWLLQRDPTFPISPYHHSLEVIAQFELVRQRVVDELPLAPPPELRRYPSWGYLPFGVPQFRQGRPVRGALYLGGQALTVGASVGVFLHLVLANPEPGVFPEEHPLGWTKQGATDRIYDRKYRYQWPATFGFYGLWALSVLDGQGTFRGQAQPGSGALAPLPVGIAGRW